MTLIVHHNALEAWCGVARDDFAQLRDGRKMPDVRHELLTTIKSKLIPLGEYEAVTLHVGAWS